jgi:arginine decarboxylase
MMPTTNTNQVLNGSGPVIGWEQESPVPDGYRFNSLLQANGSRLYFDNLDLTQILADGSQIPGLDRALPTPLEIVYLPIIRRQIDKMNKIFAEAIAEVDYDGRFHFTYASKANAAEEVIRTTLGAGAHHEMSSTVDVNIARIMIRRGLLTPDRFVVCNGFKTAGSDYSQNIIRLKEEHKNIIPVVEDLTELTPLIASGKSFDVGLRQKTYGPNRTAEEMEATNSRFGLNLENIWKAAAYIAAAPNLDLRLYHAMVGSQILNKDTFVDYLAPGIEVYARLRQRYPTLDLFDFGGGVPAPLTLDFRFDHHAFAVRLLQSLKESCNRYNVPVPDVMGEFGRYTTAEHGAHLFKVLTVKENGSRLPWYIINGSIMSSFPDSWCLGEHFICLPLNHLDQPFQQVQLGGITCDSDDVYPPKKSNSPLFLPVETQDLYLGFFGIGAYQEMLGGVKGSKHCVLPEAYELLVDRENSGPHQFQILRGQTPADVLRNLGYQMEEMY